MSPILRVAVAFVAGMSVAGYASGATVTVAVASNFAETLARLAQDFERSTAHRVVLVRGSSGKLFAQIVNGAPVDLFLSADAARPLELLSRDERSADSAFTYAIGQLVIWSRDDSVGGANCQRLLEMAPGKIAIANPRLAPYGKAAQEYLQGASLWEHLQPHLVFGENSAQALQFAASGNAVAALVARAQVQNLRLPAATCIREVPAGRHTPIEQLGVLTVDGMKNPVAAEFVRFMQSPSARDVIRTHGYRLPEARPNRAGVHE